ncbi:hypothetical protein [Streptomyces graminilatus]|uniref:hypothetical protein n=1 Tax=Streptomyces graminilatus TaxID=1464070 RepID=UPI0006E2193A|nr:hypothetical protein [Streptomyces graminilatus]
MADFRPTRAHPHRFCLPLHMAYGVAVLFAAAGLILEQPVMFLFLIAFGVITTAVSRLISGTPAADAARQSEDPKEPELAPHRIWGGVAVTMDALLVVSALVVWIALLGNSSGDLVPQASVSGYVALALSIAFLTVHLYAHHAAAIPAADESVPA